MPRYSTIRSRPPSRLPGSIQHDFSTTSTPRPRITIPISKQRAKLDASHKGNACRYRVLPPDWMLEPDRSPRDDVVNPGKDPLVKTYVYKKTKQADLKILVHFPPGAKATDKRPGIVFFFGGGFQFGDASQFQRQADYFASRGMVAARADYRVKSRHGVAPDSCVEDAKVPSAGCGKTPPSWASIQTAWWPPAARRADTWPPVRRARGWTPRRKTPAFHQSPTP